MKHNIANNAHHIATAYMTTDPMVAIGKLRLDAVALSDGLQMRFNDIDRLMAVGSNCHGIYAELLRIERDLNDFYVGLRSNRYRVVEAINMRIDGSDDWTLLNTTVKRILRDGIDYAGTAIVAIEAGKPHVCSSYTNCIKAKMSELVRLCAAS